jgi:ferrous iron transport protein B
MSCSARLPVWGLLLAFLVPSDKPWLGGLALTGIYLLSLVFASLVAVVGGKILRIAPSYSGFQVELPQWRPPTFRTVVVSAWDRTVSYLQRAGLTILGVSVAFWLFMNLPSPDHSVATMVGQWIAPLLKPMGVDWRVGVALIAAFAAREVFVSALAVVFSVQAARGTDQGLVQAMRQATFEGTNHHVFTFASTAGLVVFFLIALQCLTTVAVMRKEVSTRFALGQMVGFVALAWVLASATVQGLRLFGVA